MSLDGASKRSSISCLISAGVFDRTIPAFHSPRSHNICLIPLAFPMNPGIMIVSSGGGKGFIRPFASYSLFFFSHAAFSFMILARQPLFNIILGHSALRNVISRRIWLIPGWIITSFKYHGLDVANT